MHMPDKCERCRVNKPVTVSMFSTAWICAECKDRETEHPKYPEAVRSETAAVRSGDYNFRGIGEPPDLHHGS